MKDSDLFHVDIFSQKRRFSPSWLNGFLTFRFRWTIYGYLPVVIFLFAGRSIYKAAAHGSLEEIGFALALGSFASATLMFGFWWYHHAPYWYLNGTDRDWETVTFMAGENGHAFPDDFHDPLILGEPDPSFSNEFFDPAVSTFEPDIEGFIVGNINLGMKQPAAPAGGIFDFYLEVVYWQIDDRGLSFYGERMNVRVPYSCILHVSKGLSPLDILLTLNQDRTGIYHELRITMGHFRTFVADCRLRNEMYDRIRERWLPFHSVGTS